MEAKPNARVFVMYGASEATARMSYLPPEDLTTKLGSIGRGIPGVELHVLDETGQPVRPGQTGEIYARGDNISPGYLDDPEATADKFPGGMLRTGDLATVDADGYVYVLDRKDDFIKSWGHRVSSQEIEAAVLTLPDLVSAAAVGVPDPMAGRGDLAVRHGQPSLRGHSVDIARHCEKSLAKHKHPKRVRFLAAMPLNSAGKVRKSQLRHLAADDRWRPATMAPDRGVLARELAILASLHRQSDPVLASLVAALYLEDATGVVLSDSQRCAGGLSRSRCDRLGHAQGRAGLLMCGVCGVVSFDEPPDLRLVTEMLRRLTHRGPDGWGYYRDRLVALGHTRLAIIDQAGGAQPLANEDGTVWVTFNGEIFNYVELGDELRSLGHSSGQPPTPRSSSTPGSSGGTSAFGGSTASGRSAYGTNAVERNSSSPGTGWASGHFSTSATADRFLFASEIKALFCRSRGVARVRSRSGSSKIFTFWCPTWRLDTASGS